MPPGPLNPLTELAHAKSDLERDVIHRANPETSAENAVARLTALHDLIKAETNPSPYIADLGRVLGVWIGKMAPHPTPTSTPPVEPKG